MEWFCHWEESAYLACRFQWIIRGSQWRNPSKARTWKQDWNRKHEEVLLTGLMLCSSWLALGLHSYVPQGHQPGDSATHCAPKLFVSAHMDAMQAAGENRHYWSYPVLDPACYSTHLIGKICPCWNNYIILMGMINHYLLGSRSTPQEGILFSVP